MPFYEANNLKFYCFNILTRSSLFHGIYTRLGGVSPEPWASLNLGGTVGDERANVVENRKRIFDSVGRNVDSIFDPWQVHGTDVICAVEPRPLDNPHQKADAILTNRKNITLFMRFADCVPILLFDPVQHVIGIIHAGWKGTVAGTAASAVNIMLHNYRSKPANIIAGIGPSICLKHYPVGPEVVSAVKKSFGIDADALIWNSHGFSHFNLRRANQVVLERCGVQQIEQSNLCTVCHNDDWFSHRAENGRTGRFGVLIALK